MIFHFFEETQLRELLTSFEKCKYDVSQAIKTKDEFLGSLRCKRDFSTRHVSIGEE
jgi:hypothetical protein